MISPPRQSHEKEQEAEDRKSARLDKFLSWVIKKIGRTLLAERIRN